jgi:hypothetical protein
VQHNAAAAGAAVTAAAPLRRRGVHASQLAVTALLLRLRSSRSVVVVVGVSNAIGREAVCLVTVWQQQ